MRPFFIVLLGPAACMTCVASSFGSNKTEGNVMTSVSLDVHDVNSSLVNHLGRMQTTKSDEERMPQNVALMVPGRIDLIRKSALSKAMNTLHVDRNAYMLTEGAWNRLQSLDRFVLDSFVKRLPTYSLKQIMSLSPSTQEKAVRKLLLEKARTSTDGEKQLMRAILAQRERSKNKIKPVNTKKTAKQESTISDRKRSINELVWYKPDDYESLDTSMAAFGSVADFAPAVSIAKRSRILGGKAKQLQDAMLASWQSSEKSVGEIFNLLGLSKLRERGFTYENLDTLAQYIALLNKERDEIDMFSYLIKKFGGGELVMMILSRTKTSMLVNVLFDRKKIDERKTPAEICETVLTMTDDVDSLLDTLLAAFGGAEKLAPVISAVKTRRTTGEKAKRLQDAMLASWQSSEKSVGEIFNLLGLSKLRKRGFTYENLDTLAQYIALLNKERDEIDMFSYLRKNFGGDELVLMILSRTKTSMPVNVPVVRLWMDESKTSGEICESILAMTDDVDSLLEPLLAAFGGPEKLAPIVSAVKTNDITGEKANRLQDAMLASWQSSEKSVGEIFNLLGLSKLRERGFTYENLDTLERYIALLNGERDEIEMFSYLRKEFGDIELVMMILSRTKTSMPISAPYVRRWIGEAKTSAEICETILALADDMDSLLEPLMAAFGPAKLAPMVSFAKRLFFIKSKAEQLQDAMLASWQSSEKSVGEIFNLLGLSKLRERGFTYENLDTLAQYIAMLNKERDEIDMFSYLIKKFGGGELVMMILSRTKTSMPVNTPFVRLWMDERKMSAEICETVLTMTDDVDSLLEPLLAAFGGPEKLAPVVSAAKKSFFNGGKAKRLQDAMLASWQGSEKSVGEIFNLLGLSKLRKRGFTYENLDTLERYIALLNGERDEIDVLTYLRSKFDDGILTLMILEQKEVSVYTNALATALTQRWRTENKSPEILPTGLITGDMELFEMSMVDEYYASAMASK